jgi:hypothetical protein
MKPSFRQKLFELALDCEGARKNIISHSSRIAAAMIIRINWMRNEPVYKALGLTSSIMRAAS